MSKKLFDSPIGCHCETLPLCGSVPPGAADHIM